MDIEEFLTELTVEACRHRWQIRGGLVRTWETVRQCAAPFPSEDLAEGSIEAPCYCPITALCAARLGVVFMPDQYPYAASRLGIAPSDANRIADAADDREHPLRARILAAVGITEPQP